MQMGDKTLTGSARRPSRPRARPAERDRRRRRAAGSTRRRSGAGGGTGIGNPGGPSPFPRLRLRRPRRTGEPRGDLAEMLRLTSCGTTRVRGHPRGGARCGKFGRWRRCHPRPDAEGEGAGGPGKVFVLYADVAGAAAARDALHGRKFGGKTVVADFLDPEAFAKRDF